MCLTQWTFQEVAGPLCRRMPGNPASPSLTEDGGSSSWPGNSKLASGGWPGGWGGKASQLFVGWQGIGFLCPIVSLLSQDSSMLCWDHSLYAGEDWGLDAGPRRTLRGLSSIPEESTGPCTAHFVSGQRFQGRSENCRRWLGRIMNEVIIKGKPNTGLPSISTWCAKGQTAAGVEVCFTCVQGLREPPGQASAERSWNDPGCSRWSW